eukprot:m.66182 g.66182  ORF g.66182 m.66182 type:complete len:235 (-) comp13723_c0_seq2:704-1408(-)
MCVLPLQIHWFSIVNSLATVFILSVAFAFILVRTLSADIARYNEEGEDDFDDIEPTGWKLVAGDVFRPPPHIEWLTTFIGTGIELLVMSVVTILFACFGMLSPSSRGALMTEAIVAFVLAGAYAGFHAGRFYRTFGGQNWKQQALLLALFFPGLVFGLGFLLNLLIWGKQSSGAVPFTTVRLQRFRSFNCVSPDHQCLIARPASVLSLALLPSLRSSPSFACSTAHPQLFPLGR